MEPGENTHLANVCITTSKRSQPKSSPPGVCEVGTGLSKVKKILLLPNPWLPALCSAQGGGGRGGGRTAWALLCFLLQHKDGILSSTEVFPPPPPQGRVTQPTTADSTSKEIPPDKQMGCSQQNFRQREAICMLLAHRGWDCFGESAPPPPPLLKGWEGSVLWERQCCSAEAISVSYHKQIREKDGSKGNFKNT